MSDMPTADVWLAQCSSAIRCTAERLGVDPVAFAEACQDGELLALAMTVCEKTHAKRKRSVGDVSIVAGMLAALKRAEPQS